MCVCWLVLMHIRLRLSFGSLPAWNTLTAIVYCFFFIFFFNKKGVAPCSINKTITTILTEMEAKHHHQFFFSISQMYRSFSIINSRYLKACWFIFRDNCILCELFLLTRASTQTHTHHSSSLTNFFIILYEHCVHLLASHLFCFCVCTFSVLLSHFSLIRFSLYFVLAVD